MAGISTYGQSLTQIRLLNNQNENFTRLANQLTTGLKTDRFSGLGLDAMASQRSRADVKAIDTYINNIDNAERRLDAMLTSIREFKEQAENLSSAMLLLSQEGVHQKGDKIIYDDPLTPAIETTEIGMSSGEIATELETITDLADNLYPLLVDFLNIRDGDRYLLSGTDTNTAPISNNGTLDAAVSSLIQDWKDETLPAAQNLNNTELISALRSRTSADDPNAITDTIVGYSATLSAGNINDVYIRVTDTTEIKYTAAANEQAFRDVMVVTAFLSNSNLTPIADAYAEPYTAGDPTIADGAPGATLEEQKQNFFAVFNDMAQMLNTALDDIDTVEYQLESARVRMHTTRESLVEQKNALLNTVSEVEQVDTNEIAVRINAMQVQIEASYRVTALTNELNLTRFI
ncbi:MAG: hypothetical protein CBB87_01970 [Micavibrio sp. TMED27]|nr:hypothetical protein [Micavibrio sp.]OUT92529.1 MAG: hypothetical protein CBB87_01970 [Micavibrio sp. TMED27]|tara:strand:+ start:1156 stop:2367 length:1212 start_codon:yes stop_codon:yes gene_type:complete